MAARSSPVTTFLRAACAASGILATAPACAEPVPLASTPPRLTGNLRDAAAPATWNYSYSYNGTGYTDGFIGADPAKPATTTVPVYLVPLELVFGTTIANPDAPLANGQTVVTNTVASPVFQPYPFVFAKTAMGQTQYGDAFLKANFWNLGGSNAAYHVLLGAPKIMPLRKITVPASEGGLTNAFGVENVIGVYQAWLQTQMAALITTLKIPAKALPVFVTTQSFLLSSPNVINCCIGGLHAVTGTGQPFVMFSYIQRTGAFSEDVSSLSAQIAGWLTDPYHTNNSPCGAYEPEYPLEAQTGHGDYPYVLGGFTYHLQDLTLLPYFGDGSGNTLNNAFTLRGSKLTICQDGP